MMRLASAVLLTFGLTIQAGVAPAQAVPEGSAADRLRLGWRRPSSFRIDPFRHVALPHWGVVFSFGARAENNTVNFADLGAFILLDRDDDVLIGDVIDALGLIPRGGGLGGGAESENGVYLGGPIGQHVRIGFTLQARGYSGLTLDDAAVALLRDGNAAAQEFTLGESRLSALATTEAGLHGLWRFGPLGGLDAVQLSLGAGIRLVRPIAYAAGHSAIAGGGRVLVTGDSIAANVALETHVTPLDEIGDAIAGRGSGVAADLLLRAEWPTNGLALEVMVGNLGSVRVERVERRTLTVDVATTSLDTVVDVINDLDLTVQDTMAATVDLPRIVRLSGAAWANRVLQLDVAATLPVSGAFAAPLSVDLGTTWRFIGALPLRLGVILGGHQGLGYSAGVAVESRHLIFRVAGQSLGGLFRHATGAGGRFELGFLF